MNLHNQLTNNLEELGLNRIKEQLDTYLDLVADGKKTMLEALYELSEMEMKFRIEQAVTGCVKVANFPYLKEVQDFGYQPSIDKAKIIITTNSPFSKWADIFLSKWADIFQEPVLTNALLDRLLHYCSVININGPSYRLKDQMQHLTEERSEKIQNKNVGFST